MNFDPGCNGRGSVSGLVVSILLAVTASTASAPASSSPPNRVVPSEVASTLEDGVYSGRYTVLRAAGSKGTFYVFSDPACGYCRRLERELEELGKSYTIHIFPVSVVGEYQSRESIRRLMCNGAATRLGAWRDAIGGYAASGRNCADGDAAIEANDRNFFGLGFTGTPTIVSARGERMPNSFETAADIERWLKQQAARH